MDRPLLLLDIDGVLNPWAATTLPEGFAEYVLFPADEEPHRFAAHHGEWIRELARSFDVVWASAWGSVANRLLAPILGLPEFPWVPFPPTPFPPFTKVPSIAEYVDERAVAWVDDGMGPDAWAWASERQAPTLLVRVDPAVGFVLEHVAALNAWRNELVVYRRRRGRGRSRS
jgi:hypothetical protein